MAPIQTINLSFTYPGSFVPVFTGLNISIDSSWRLGLVGRNGRGKTTLLRLLAGELQGSGQIVSPLQFDRFPFPLEERLPALSALRAAVAPFDQWEQEMEALLKAGGKTALQRWGELEHQYAAADGYSIDSFIQRECGKLGIPAEALGRALHTFSPGERTRMMLAALFLRKDRFLLIDEPTNHLDMQGRDIAAEYLAGKSGFLLVSHDRAFLDRSVDHILALQRSSVRVEQGNYASYRANKQLQDDFEWEKNERLKQDIRWLSESSREKARWSDQVEATKIGHGVGDRGFVGHKAAKMMKRGLAIQQRIQAQVEEKESLLQDIEYTAPVTLPALTHPNRTLLTAQEVCFGYEERDLFRGFQLTVSRGERIALLGENGAGKSTLLKLLGGELLPRSGSLHRPGDLLLSTLPQSLEQVQGTPRDWALREGLPTDLLFTLLRKFAFSREDLDRDARGFSMGQRKKLLLAASMARPAHLYLWDEPLNYIDAESREQIEMMLKATDAAIVFVEHDRRFVETVATRVIPLDQ